MSQAGPHHIATQPHLLSKLAGLFIAFLSFCLLALPLEQAFASLLASSQTSEWLIRADGEGVQCSSTHLALRYALVMLLSCLTSEFAGPPQQQTA